MANISGNLSDDARLIIVNESDWTVESNTTKSAGAFVVTGLDEGTKTIISRSTSGESIGYGGVTSYAPPGLNWQEYQPQGDINKLWTGIAVDSDGSAMIVGQLQTDGWGGTQGQLFHSTDGGQNWTERTPAGAGQYRNWHFLAMDSDGSHIIASAYSSRFYVSTDYGVNWTERYPTGFANNYQWYPSAISSNGQNMIVLRNLSRIYKSSNEGVNWSETQPAGNVNKAWNAVAMSPDGQKLMACQSTAGSGGLYVSNNFGTNWTQKYPVPGTPGEKITYASADANISKMIAIAGPTTARVYVTSNGGDNWTEVFPLGTNTAEYYYKTSISPDGSVIAVTKGAATYPDRDIYVSFDFGTTWILTNPSNITSRLYGRELILTNDKIYYPTHDGYNSAAPWGGRFTYAALSL